MSDVSGGPGWWQASDGKWYAPEQHSNYRPPPSPPLPQSVTPASPPAGPEPLFVEPARVAPATESPTSASEAGGAEGWGTIEVARRSVLQDNVRRYLVFIDEAPIGVLWAFRTGRYRVPAGRHSVRLSISLSSARSATLVVDVPPGGVRRLRTRGRGARNVARLPVDMVNTQFALAKGAPFPDRGPWIVLTPDD